MERAAKARAEILESNSLVNLDNRYLPGGLVLLGGGRGSCPPCPPASYGHVMADTAESFRSLFAVIFRGSGLSAASRLDVVDRHVALMHEEMCQITKQTTTLTF